MDKQNKNLTTYERTILIAEERLKKAQEVKKWTGKGDFVFCDSFPKDYYNGEYKGKKKKNKTRITMRRIQAKYGNRCYVCGEIIDMKIEAGNLMPTIEHVIPKSRNGTNKLDNLRLSHSICNNMRGNDVA